MKLLDMVKSAEYQATNFMNAIQCVLTNSNTMQNNNPSSFRYFRTETNQWEDVLPEKWRWMVIYGDGSTLKQFADDGIFHQTKEIKQEYPFVFIMYNVATGQQYKMYINAPRTKLKYFYRNTVLEVGTPNERRIKLYIFAYKFYDVYNYHVIMPDDTMIITTDLSFITVI